MSPALTSTGFWCWSAADFELRRVEGLGDARAASEGARVELAEWS
jgi:hypothetical protein